MTKKVIWFISLLVLVAPLLLVGCGGEESASFTNVSNNPGDSSGPRLAVDKDNGLHLVWFDLSTGTNQIMYSEKTPNSGWSKPLNLSNSFSNSRNPRIALDSQGTLHVVWYEYADGKFRIFYSRRPDGGVWSEPYDVTRTRQAATYPSLVVDEADTVHVVWEEDRLKQDTELYYTDIYYSHRNSDGTWSEAVNLSNNDGDSTRPMIVADSLINLHVVWEDDTSGVKQLYYADKPKDGKWSEPAVITHFTESASDPLNQAMAVDGHDMLHLAWNDKSSGNWEIFYSSKPAEGSWSSPVNISRNNSNSGVPSFTLDKRDTLYLVWNDDSSGEFDILLSSKPSGGDWSQVMNISQTWEKSGDPCIVVDNVLHVHVVWSEYITDKSNWDIVYTSRLGIGSD